MYSEAQFNKCRLINPRDRLSNRPHCYISIQEPISPLRAYELFHKIREEDMSLLWMNQQYGTAESLLIWTVPVPPVPIRPSVPMEMGGGAGSNEDDITIKLQEIIDVNNALRLALDKGATIKMVAEDWEFLQIQVSSWWWVRLSHLDTPGPISGWEGGS